MAARKGTRAKARSGPSSSSKSKSRPRTEVAPAAPRRLWAPWRLAFIEGPKAEGCIFCHFPAEEGEQADRRNLIVHRAEAAFTILNRYPYNSGHVMVVPCAHVDRLEALDGAAFAGLHAELALAARVVRAAYRPEGMNVGMNLGRIAGAGIADHLHYHIVPRWGGDTNFMPVLADVRVMVEHLDATWARLRKGFGGS
jgi:ATP adenylyltransferase